MAKRGLSRSLLAGAALLGCLWLGTQPAGATTTIHEYGYWARTLDTDDDGNRVCGVRTEMHGGGELRLMVIDGDVHLIAHDPDWDMHRGDTYAVRIFVDNESFSGTGRAVDSETLMVKNLSNHFLDQFTDGMQMVASFGGIRWRVSLVGSSRAMDDMQTCIANQRRGPMS